MAVQFVKLIKDRTKESPSGEGSFAMQTKIDTDGKVLVQVSCGEGESSEMHEYVMGENGYMKIAK